MTGRSELQTATGRDSGPGVFPAALRNADPASGADAHGATPRRRRHPLAVVSGGLLVLAAAVLVAGGAFVPGFGALGIGTVLLLWPPRSRRRRRRGVLRAAAAWLTRVSAGGVRGLRSGSLRAWRRGRPAGAGALRAGVGAVSQLARGSRNVLGQLGLAVGNAASAAWKRGAPASSRLARQGGAKLAVAGQRARAVATELGSRASRAAVAEAAHLGEVVLVPPALPSEGEAPNEAGPEPVAESPRRTGRAAPRSTARTTAAKGKRAAD